MLRINDMAVVLLL